MNRSVSLLAASREVGNPKPLALIEDRPFQLLDWTEVGEVPVELVYDPEESRPYRIQVNGETWDDGAERSEAETLFEDVRRDLKVSARDERLVEMERLGL